VKVCLIFQHTPATKSATDYLVQHQRQDWSLMSLDAYAPREKSKTCIHPISFFSL